MQGVLPIIAAGDVSFARAGDLRYVGQGYELRVPFPSGRLDTTAIEHVFADFHALHKTEYGHVFTHRSVLLDTAVHGHIPVNHGLVLPIKIIAPKGCLANPEFPAPTIARFCPGNQLADTVMKALGQAMPQHISAGATSAKASQRSSPSHRGTLSRSRR